jgi:hypothetical protein
MVEEGGVDELTGKAGSLWTKGRRTVPVGTQVLIPARAATGGYRVEEDARPRHQVETGFRHVGLFTERKRPTGVPRASGIFRIKINSKCFPAWENV